MQKCIDRIATQRNKIVTFLEERVARRRGAGEKNSWGEEMSGNGGEGEGKGGHDRGISARDRYKSFNGFEGAVSRAAASFALPLRAACELSKNKINYGTGGVFMRREEGEEEEGRGGGGGARRPGDYRPKLRPTKSNSPLPSSASRGISDYPSPTFGFLSFFLPFLP